jgi:hypothetical protein
MDTSKPHPLSEQNRQSLEINKTSLTDSAVQYLHRTVKDFLENPTLWDQLIAANRSPYDPYLALCRSFVTQFKVMSPDSLSREASGELFGSACGKRISASNSVKESKHRKVSYPCSMNLTVPPPSFVTLLLKVDQHSCTNYRTPISNYAKGALQPHWVCTFPHVDPESGLAFLSLAVKLDLYIYVEAKVKKGRLVKQG